MITVAFSVDLFKSTDSTPHETTLCHHLALPFAKELFILSHLTRFGYAVP
jgi:hypothetical protein